MGKDDAFRLRIKFEGVKKLLSRFPESKLEAMAVKSINKNGEKAAEFLEGMARDKGVYIKIKDMEALQK